MRIRRAADRGHTDIGWLDSRHSFSFGDYFDPDNQGFRSLRVINDDRIAAGAGFGTHPHRDMEIVTFVLDGALAHKDSMAHTSVMRPGDVQHMTAGTGITHSEFNASNTDPVHLLQVWILPERAGLEPSYEQRAFEPSEDWQLVLSREGPITIRQDVAVYRAQPRGGTLLFEPRPGRHAYLHVAKGSVEVNGKALGAGDAVTTTGRLDVRGAAQLLLFDLA